MSFHRRLMEQESDEKSKGSYTIEEMRKLSAESEDTITEDFDIEQVLDSNSRGQRHTRLDDEKPAVKPVKCTKCSKEFQSAESLRGHKMKSHGQESARKFQGNVLSRLDEILKTVRENRRR